MFDSDDDDQETCFADDLIVVRSKTESKTQNESKAKTETKTENKPVPKAEAKTKTEPIIVCWVCGNKFKNQIGLQTHMNKH